MMTRRSFIVVAGSAVSGVFQGCGGVDLGMSVVLWPMDDFDYFRSYAHLPNGTLVHRDDTFHPHFNKKNGWVGGGMDFSIREVPDYILASWRRPPADETLYEKCLRTGFVEDACRGQEGNSKGWTDRDEGELIGPFQVPLRSRVSKRAFKLMYRPGTRHTLQVGIGMRQVGPLPVRWILRGPRGDGRDGSPYGNLEQGGDW